MTDKMNLTKSGLYWEGGPVTLTESITARKATANKYDSFIEGLREQIERTKSELDATLADTKLEQSTAICEKKANECEVSNIDTLVNEKAAEITAEEREQKIKDFLKLQYQAASFIVDLKTQIKETEKVNHELKTQVDQQNNILINKMNELEKEEQKMNINMTNRLKLTKMIGANPPPKFDDHKAFGTANGLLAFLNEDLNEYFEDICMTDTNEKCRLVLKTFGPRSEDYKCTARRFFMQETVEQLIKHQDVTMKIIYKELVHFVFASKPKGEVGKRRHGESLTNYLTRWFTIKDYCGIPENKQGKGILRSIFDKPELVDCREEIIREIKAKFFVTYANDENISKGALLGFAQRLDMLYAEKNESGIHAIGSYDKKPTGMIAIDQRQKAEKSNENVNLEQKINDWMKTMESKQTDFVRRCYNCNSPDHIARNCPQNKPRQGYPNMRQNNGARNSFNNRQNFRANNGINNDSQRETRTCFICSKQGHISVNCWHNPNNKNKPNGRNPQQMWRNDFNVKNFNQNINEIRSFEINLDSLCAMNKNGDIREYVETSLTPGRTELSLLDTGAMVNAINMKLVEDCGMQNKIDRTREGQIELANKEIAFSAGALTTFVEIAGRKYQIEFRVVPNLKPEIIYGAPFLKDTGILQDFRKSVTNHLGVTKN